MFLGLFLFFSFAAFFIYLYVFQISEDKGKSIVSVIVFVISSVIFVNLTMNDNWGMESLGCGYDYNYTLDEFNKKQSGKKYNSIFYSIHNLSIF